MTTQIRQGDTNKTWRQKLEKQTQIGEKKKSSRQEDKKFRHK